MSAALPSDARAPRRRHLFQARLLLVFTHNSACVAGACGFAAANPALAARSPSPPTLPGVGGLRRHRCASLPPFSPHMAWLSLSPQILPCRSVGCIFAEVLLGKPLFPGKNVAHQLEIITDLLGTPPPHVLEKVRLSLSCVGTGDRRAPLPHVREKVRRSGRSLPPLVCAAGGAEFLGVHSARAVARDVLEERSGARHRREGAPPAVRRTGARSARPQVGLRCVLAHRGRRWRSAGASRPKPRLSIARRASRERRCATRRRAASS